MKRNETASGKFISMKPVYERLGKLLSDFNKLSNRESYILGEVDLNIPQSHFKHPHDTFTPSVVSQPQMDDFCPLCFGNKIVDFKCKNCKI